MPIQNVQICVVGSGLIGLAIALELRERGMSVTVFGDNRPGTASVAAAVMLAPLSESGDLSESTMLGIESLDSYPEFLDRVEARSKIAVPLRGRGTLRLAPDYENSEALKSTYDHQSAGPLPLFLLNAAEAVGLEPLLSQRVTAAVFSPKERQLEPAVLRDALLKAVVQAGGSVVPATCMGITELQSYCQVDTSAGKWSCDRAVVCGGAWVHEIIPELIGAIVPVKGQIGSICEPDLSLSGITIYRKSVYMVPRANGRIVVGATEEGYAGYSTELTKSADGWLIDSARQLIPSLRSNCLSDHWAGTRPVSFDGAPIIGGRHSGSRVIVAGGHGRNGVLLTPITARITADLIQLNRDVPSPFACARASARAVTIT